MSRPSTQFAVILALLLASSAHAAAPAAASSAVGTPGNPLRPYARCLDPAQIIGWHTLGNRELLVSTMRAHFRIGIDPACAGLLNGPTLRFSAGFSGLVCGTIGEAVLSQEQRCSINRIERISTAQYRQLLGETGAPAPAAAASTRGPKHETPHP